MRKVGIIWISVERYLMLFDGLIPNASTSHGNRSVVVIEWRGCRWKWRQISAAARRPASAPAMSCCSMCATDRQRK